MATAVSIGRGGRSGTVRLPAPLPRPLFPPPPLGLGLPLPALAALWGGNGCAPAFGEVEVSPAEGFGDTGVRQVRPDALGFLR